ncbi:tRNA (adenine(22)-N(1))-methyltransferase [Amphritea balenae]|uniref:SAM-dependent methyltransferase n=1 Tax=Amphritea balenae TaxID=452629 RepID=A0A3P1SRN5_9GAMM|nr:tRNA (adenine(22)-N(1))-methyltransferase TrmK [Amphritea balenae]RRC99709.1 SAM-dependent methyltransferase [Amphritea balenae]
MKISLRLQQIDQMITDRYNNIFDCCCDHGLLGQTLLHRKAGDTIHFVDVVESIMTQLRQQLEQQFSELTETRWQIHCQDVATLKLPDTGKSLIIIAGVGGDLLIDLVSEITDRYPGLPLEFILCPVYHNYKVRTALIGWGFNLLNEQLVRDNNQFYEILHVSKNLANPKASVLSAVGSQMWDLSRPDHRQYLERTIQHYQRMAQRQQSEVMEIVSQYKTLKSDKLAEL